MRIVVTGAAGYIGSQLCKEFVDHGYHVTGFDDCIYNQFTTWKKLYNILGDNLYASEVLEWDDNLCKAIEKADVIIPLAAIVGAPACDKLLDYSWDINHNWFFQLLKHVDKQLIIYPNTNSGYGTTPQGQITTEESLVNPISAYGKQKQDTENLLLQEYDNVTCFRLATVFGWSLRPRLDLLVNNFVYNAVSQGKLSVYNGHVRRNFICIQDVIRAFKFTIEHGGNMRGQVYNLGTDELNATKLDFAKQVGQILQIPVVEIDGPQDTDKRDYIVSNEKLSKEGFFPVVTSLDDNVNYMVYKIQKLLDKYSEGMKPYFNY